MITEKTKPLYTLTVGEYIELTRETVLTVIGEKRDFQNTNGENEEHFTIAQLAKFLNCSLVSIHSYKKKGLPFYRVGRKVLFKKTEVLAFMHSTAKGRRRIC